MRGGAQRGEGGDRGRGEGGDREGSSSSSSNFSSDLLWVFVHHAVFFICLQIFICLHFTVVRKTTILFWFSLLIDMLV